MRRGGKKSDAYHRNREIFLSFPFLFCAFARSLSLSLSLLFTRSIRVVVTHCNINLLLLSIFIFISIMSSASSYRLAGQVICLSGASSGIGAAIAAALLEQGANICIGARRVDRLEQVAKDCHAKFPDSPGKITFTKLDVTDRVSVQGLVDKACSEFGVESVDAMVCCAGVMYFTKMKNAKMDQWDQTIDVNCRGITNCYGTVIPPMVKAGKGRIITISSDAGDRDFPNLAVYCASKQFVETLTEITRRELVGTGVSLSTIQPGDVKGTELLMKNSDQEAVEAFGIQIGKPVGEGFTREQLLDTSDVANAVVYCLTAPAHVSINKVLIEARDQE
jgi:NADP-dependent 3-hydroxy acid dehydrogenase YdfG